MTCCPQLDRQLEWTREAQSLREWCDERGIVTANADQWAEWRRWFDSREAERVAIRGEETNEAA
jgi:hypothetical protein